MNKPLRHALTLNGRDPSLLRGDPIDGERYWSREFAQREWDGLWSRIWHVAGRESELCEPGDYLVHDFMHESVIVVRQNDGSLRAFYNACAHRGQRLVWNSAHARSFHCPYHGWVYGLDGVVREVPDPESYAQGDPCGKVALRTVRVDTWGGFVWYTMDPQAAPLLEYLEPIPELYAAYPLDRLVRVGWMRIDLDTNWKFVTDNFSESYHTRTVHPQVPPWIDQDYWSARHEMFPRGHGRTIQPMRPSLRDRLPPDTPHFFDDLLRQWGIDPASYPDFETRATQGWLDLKQQKRKLWKERGYLHYEKMDDEQLTDSLHTVIFPNVTISFLPDHVIFYRSEPHPDDPGKCSFDLWSFIFPVEGVSEGEVVMFGRMPYEEADFCDHRSFDRGRGVPELAGQIVHQDMMLAEGQQRGMHSRGYRDSYLSSQETRVRLFHEVLNDWLTGRR
jgi:phenylpropionate dioxygenase-like ring-hydroxylating dioxygenase large terminal subunit